MDFAHPQSNRTDAFGRPEGSLENLSPEWLGFWFEPWRYLHASWWPLLPVDDATTPVNVTLLRLGYREVCERLDLPPCWSELPGQTQQQQLVGLSQALPRAHELLSAFWDESVPLDPEDRDWVSRQRLATALDRRFMAHEYDSGGRMTALWVLLRCLQADFGVAWHRLRLVFPRHWLEAVNEHNWSAQSVVWGLAVNQRVTRRLSSALWQRVTSTASTTETGTNDSDIREDADHDASQS